MFWWHGRQRPDPTKPSCSVLVALWGPSADRTWAIPGSARTTAPGKTQNQRRPGALLVGGAQTGSGRGIVVTIGGSPFSARIVKPANEQRKRHLESSARLARAGQIASPPQFGPYPLLQTARILERSNLDMSAYNRATQGIYPTISWYERSMSKKMLDMH